MAKTSYCSISILKLSQCIKLIFTWTLMLTTKKFWWMFMYFLLMMMQDDKELMKWWSKVEGELSWMFYHHNCTHFMLYVMINLLYFSLGRGAKLWSLLLTRLAGQVCGNEATNKLIRSLKFLEYDNSSAKGEFKKQMVLKCQGKAQSLTINKILFCANVKSETEAKNLTHKSIVVK